MEQEDWGLQIYLFPASKNILCSFVDKLLRLIHKQLNET